MTTATPDPNARSLHVPTPAATACSVVFDAEQIDAYGTAARADFIVALEQPGPWGRLAAVESHLDPALGQELDSAISLRTGRLLLIRTPGAHADPSPGTDGSGPSGTARRHDGRPSSGRRRVRVARTGAGGWMVAAELEDPALLLTMPDPRECDPAAIVDHLGGSTSADAELLVCTNGRRDVCCAVRGRPVALVGSDRHPGRVWEATHTGGHRFAPTGILLPWGRVLARLDVDLVDRTLAAAADRHLPAELLGPTHDRGAMNLTPQAQTAESAARYSHGWTGLDDVSVAALDDPRSGGAQTRWAVVHSDGTEQEVAVETSAGPDLAESCGKAPVATRVLTPSLVDRPTAG